MTTHSQHDQPPTAAGPCHDETMIVLPRSHPRKHCAFALQQGEYSAFPPLAARRGRRCGSQARKRGAWIEQQTVTTDFANADPLVEVETQCCRACEA